MKQKGNLLWCIVILVVALIALLPSSPVFNNLPDVDSSIFLYIGQKIRLGELPFRDWYDHKPPLIFYLNALGLTLGAGNRWGVWALELISVTAAALFGFGFLRRFFGNKTAGFAACITLLNLAFVLERGNLTEEYALPYMFGAVYLLGRMEGSARPWGYPFGIGCMLAMASSLKQPMAGVGLAIGVYLAVVYLLQNDWRGLLRAYLWIGAGVIVIWLGWFAYFALAGIFPEFWEAAFQYNFALSGIPPQKRIQALFNAIRDLANMSEYFLFGMLTWLVLVPYRLWKEPRALRFLTSRWLGLGLSVVGLLVGLKGLSSLAAPVSEVEPVWLKATLLGVGLFLLVAGALFLSGSVARWAEPKLVKNAPEQYSPLFLPLMIALVDFPVAIAFSSLSGNNYLHYFMGLLPSMAILAAVLIDLIRSESRRVSQPAMAQVWMSVFFLVLALPGILKTNDTLTPRRDRQVEEVITYVKNNTQPGDYVLQWGVAPAVNLLTGRDAPSRFFFADPLFVAGYSGRLQTDLFHSELKARPPVLIVDQKLVRLPFLTASSDQCGRLKDPVYYDEVMKTRTKNHGEIPQLPDGMGEVYEWICQNYSPVATVGELQWDVYRLKGN